jgi:hypothetical protein
MSLQVFTLKVTCIALFICLLAFTGPGQGWAEGKDRTDTIILSRKDIVILSQDEYGCNLELTLQPFQMETIQDRDEVYHRIVMKGEKSRGEWAKTDQVGCPELPVLGVLIKVPRSGTSSIQILEQTYTSVHNCVIYPVPRLISQEDGTAYTEFAKDKAVYHSSEFFPGTLAEIGQTGLLHDQAVARVKIYPFRWNPETGELRSFDRILLRVRFDYPLRDDDLLPDGSPSIGAQPRDAQPGPCNNPGQGTEQGNGSSQQSSRSRTRSRSKPSLIPPGKSAFRIEVKQDGIYRIPLVDNHAEINADGDITLSPLFTDPARIQLLNGEGEVAVKMVSKKSDRLSPGDYLEFFGQALDSPFTQTRVYWLFSGDTPGKRIAKILDNTKVLDNKRSGPRKSVDSFPETIHREENHTFWALTPGAPEKDYWFWERLTAPYSADYSLDLPSPVRDGSQVRLRVYFRGRSTAFPHPNHHTMIFLNGTLAGDAFWDGDQEYIQEAALPSGLLKAGNNTITITVPDDAGAVDVIYLNWIELDYSRSLEAVGNKLTFTMSEGTMSESSGTENVQVAVKNITEPDLRIYDITDPSSPREVADYSIQPDGQNYQAVFQDQVTSDQVTSDQVTSDQVTSDQVPNGQVTSAQVTNGQVTSDQVTSDQVTSDQVTSDQVPSDQVTNGKLTNEKRYCLCAVSRIKVPDNIEFWHSANLKDPANEADQIIISTRDFLPCLEPLCQLRQKQGLRVKAVSVEDIYNEFNAGVIDPAAIKDFLKYAYKNWTRPAPRYVLLVGDADTDYRDYLGTGKKSVVPAYHSITNIGLTPDDNWYVCLQGEDVLPEMMIGRIPASSPGMVTGLVYKIIAFEESGHPTPARVLLAADNDAIDYEKISDDLITFIPPEFAIDTVYLRLYATVNDATRALLSSLNQGVMIANYVGHGSVTNWAGEMMFESSDIPRLSNRDHLPFVLAMDCLNGYFAQPFSYCLAEELMAAKDKGAIACFASSGLVFLWEHELLDKELFSKIFGSGENTLENTLWNTPGSITLENTLGSIATENTLGAITTQAKIAAYAKGASEEMMKTFTLIGDPAMRLRGWK